MRCDQFSFACLLLLATLSFGSASYAVKAEKSAASGASTTSLTQDINELEADLGMNPAQEGSADQRVAALESRLLGKIESGSLVSRVERLKNINSKRQNAAGKSLPDALSLKLKASDDSVGKVISLLPLPNEYYANYVRIAPPGVKPDVTSDYFSDVMKATKGKVVRFKQMPIPVYVTPSPDPSLTRACVAGFEIWEERSAGIVRFVQIDSPERARIKVTWGHLGVSRNPQDCGMGAHTVTQWQPNPTKSKSGIGLNVLSGGSKYTVPPQVIEVNLDLIYSKPKDTRLRLLQNLIAHELGHALGILAHSPERADLMFAVTDECSRLSQRDLNTLRRLYESKVDVAL